MSSRPARRRAHARTDEPERTAETQASALRETRQRHSSETAEDYVEAIAALTDSLGEARAVDLARRFGVSHATVIRTVSRLQRDGYVSSRPYRAIFLTEHGARVAREARDRHDLVVEFLRSLDIPERVVQADAEGIEHHVSSETLDAMRRHLGKGGGKRQ